MKVKRKVILTPEDINEMIILYQTTIPSTHKLGERFKVAHKKVAQILRDSNIAINTRGGQLLETGKHITPIIEGAKTMVYESTDNTKEYIAVCKRTGTILKDPNNYSGVLTEHILKTFGDVPVPTNTYQRKKYELATGRKWYEEYFDIREVNKTLAISCKICNWTTEDITNNTGALTKHVITAHNLTPIEYLDQFPDQSSLWNVKINFNNKLNDIEQSVICLECNERFLGLTETHMMTEHKMTLVDYKAKWGDVPVFSNKTSVMLSEKAIEMNKTLENNFTSKAQVEIADYIKSFGLEVLLNNKSYLKGTEIDIVIPAKKIGIEYDGLFWHNERGGKGERYHLNKTILASDNGLKLIHIFEDEWIFKKDIVLSRIKNMLGVNDNKYYARNCTIKEIETKIKDEFLNKVHIQGADRSSIRLGAFIGDLLVGVMTFSKPRKSVGSAKHEEGAYEMVRFASLGVVGLSSKLLRHFINHYDPDKITTYADRRWTPVHEGCMYDKLGFPFMGATKPNYWYTKTCKNREHRFNYRKDILVSQGYDANKTEQQIMAERGYDRIWDCGSLKYELVFEQPATAVGCG